jgi:hypothetical protein
MKWDVFIEIAPATVPLAGVLLKYLLDGFDGVRKERYGVKGLAFVCWYGPHRRPLRLPRWMIFMASNLRALVPDASKNQISPQATSNTKKAIAFLFNSGRVPLKADDLFENKPLKIVLSGNGQLVDAKIRFESDQIAGFKLIERRAHFFRPRNYLTERALAFTYLAPGHGVALDIEYTSEEPVTFRLSGPVDGMKHSVQEKTLFGIDVDSPRRFEEKRKIVIRNICIGILLMSGASFEYFYLAFSHHGQSIITKDWTYLATLLTFVIGEWMALSAWELIKQPKKIPTALRYWVSLRVGMRRGP